MPRSRRPVSNPTEPRLRYIAKNYSPRIFYAVVVALFNAMGRDEAARAIGDSWMRAIRLGSWPFPPPGRREEKQDYSDGDDFIGYTFAVLGHVQETGEPESTPYDKYLPWLAAQLCRMYKPTRKRQKKDPEWHLHEMDDVAQQEDIDATNMRRELENRFGAIVRWANATGIDINQYSAQEALDASNAWGLLQPKGDIVPGEIVYEFGDGWTFQELKTKKQLQCEGREDVLFHCVSGYKPSRIGVEYRVFSLRDPDGWPHATMEWRVYKEYVAQFKGYDNKMPERDEVERAVEFRRNYIDENLVDPKMKLEQVTADVLEHFPDKADEFKGDFNGVYMPPGRPDLSFNIYDENFVDESGPWFTWEVWKKSGVIIGPNFETDELIDQIGEYDIRPPSDAAPNPRKRKAAKRKKTPEYKRLLDRSQRLWETYDAKPLKKHLVAFGKHAERMQKSTSLKVKAESRRAARAFNAEFKTRGWKK